MGFKPCTKCGAQIGTEAVMCPHCGLKYGRVSNSAIVLIAVVAFIVCAVLINVVTEKPEPKGTPPRPLSPADIFALNLQKQFNDSGEDVNVFVAAGLDMPEGDHTLYLISDSPYVNIILHIKGVRERINAHHLR